MIQRKSGTPGTVPTETPTSSRRVGPLKGLRSFQFAESSSRSLALLCKFMVDVALLNF
jgi:hypothetical protein